MNVELAYRETILILTLDRLIKKEFEDRYSNKFGNILKGKPLSSSRIIKHNELLVKSLFISDKIEIQKAINSFGIATRLYGHKDYHPNGKYGHTTSIQYYIDNHVPASISCNGRKSVSWSFYKSLNTFIKGFNKKKPEESTFTLLVGKFPVLFKAALPNSDCYKKAIALNKKKEKDLTKYLEIFEKETKGNPIRVKVTQDLSIHIPSLQEFHIFYGYYYSRRKNKIHGFKLGISKKILEEDGPDDRATYLHFLSPEPKKLKGIAYRQERKLSIELEREDNGGKQAAILIYIKPEIKYKNIETLQGIYSGYSLDVDEEGVLSLEFIAVSSKFLKISPNEWKKDEKDSNWKILTTLLFKRYNFGIEAERSISKLPTKGFLGQNGIHEALSEVVERISNEQLVLFHYNESNHLILSKLQFDGALFDLCFTYVPWDEEMKEVKYKHVCHLSARDKGSKTIATTYDKNDIRSVIVIDFRMAKTSNVFEGTLTFFFAKRKEPYTTYLTAVFDNKNYAQPIQEFTTEQIQEFKKETRNYNAAIERLNSLIGKNFRQRAIGIWE